MFYEHMEALDVENLLRGLLSSWALLARSDCWHWLCKNSFHLRRLSSSRLYYHAMADEPISNRPVVG